MRVPLFAVLILISGPALAHPGKDAHAGHATHAGHHMMFKAALNAAAEVPPNTSTGTGQAEASYDAGAKTLGWTVTYAFLTGPLTAGHIHGPAAPGVNAGVMIPFDNLASPIRGSAVLTADQAAALKAGKLYVNLHTAAHPGGEVRGQLLAAK